MELTKFEMPYGNTCSKCGELIAKDEAVFATSIDAVLAGQGICVKCAEPPKPKSKSQTSMKASK